MVKVAFLQSTFRAAFAFTAYSEELFQFTVEALWFPDLKQISWPVADQ